MNKITSEVKKQRLKWKKYYYNKIGMSLSEKRLIWIKNEKKCEICEQTKKLKQIEIDHDHSTGKVRGLICSGCNKGIGHMKDNLKTLTNAIKYLRKEIKQDFKNKTITLSEAKKYNRNIRNKYRNGVPYNIKEVSLNLNKKKKGK